VPSIHVVSLVASATMSGPARQLVAYAQQARLDGIEIHVLVTQRDLRVPPPLAGDLRNAQVSFGVVRDRSPLDWRMVTQVAGYITRCGAAALQTHGYKATAIGFAVKRRYPQLPWVAFFHGATTKGMKDSIYHAIERRMLRSADRVVLVSDQQRGLLSRHPEREVVVDNAAVPHVCGSSGPLLVLPGKAGGRIGVIGRLSPEKGVDVFLRACAILQREEVEFTAVIVGDGDDRPDLERLARKLQLEDRIYFMGHIDQLGGVYKQLDLVVLPSRSEGLPNVLLEALAADVPVVATAVGAVPEVLSVEGSGTLVPPCDAAQLAVAIRRTLTTGREAKARAARAAAVARYSVERRTDRLNALYRELLGDWEVA
jgi:glycosyltransferase involved in cell wall biosynthesis